MNDFPTLRREILCFWLGGEFSDTRRRNLTELTERAGVPVRLLTSADLKRWTLPDKPLHPAFEFLSAVHKSDYLRAYAMHYFGGGYSDVKSTTGNWVQHFEILERSPNAIGIGYREVGRHGVTQFDVQKRVNLFQCNWWRWRFYQTVWRYLLGNGAYIFRPNTNFTENWLGRVERRLDALLPLLKERPAVLPKERRGKHYAGIPSDYPVPWTHLLGDIFHPLCYRHRLQLKYSLPRPELVGYE